MRDWAKFTIGLVFSILCRRAAGKKQECETMEYRINHVHIRAVDPQAVMSREAEDFDA